MNKDLTDRTAFISISHYNQFERIKIMGKGRKSIAQKMKNRKNQAKKKARIKRKIAAKK